MSTPNNLWSIVNNSLKISFGYDKCQDYGQELLFLRTDKKTTDLKYFNHGKI